MKKPNKHNYAETGLISHLIELRNRLLRMVGCVLVLFMLLANFANDIYALLAEPLLKHLPSNSSMIAIEVASPFFIPFKLALLVAIFLAMPYILYQLWAFIAPGLYQAERRVMLPLLLANNLLFYLGVAFAYFLILPLIFGFLTATAPAGVAVMTDIAHYLDFVLGLFFAFGACFQVPVLTIILVLAGVTTTAELAEKRSYVIVGAFVIAMFLTPPDAISQTLLAVPMWLLFELGLLLAGIVGRDPSKAATYANAVARFKD